MARSFSSKDARSLIKEHNRFLQTLEDLAALPSKYQNDILSTAKLLAKQNVLEKAIEQDLEYNTHGGIRTSATERLLHSVYLYQHILPVASTAKQYIDLNESEIHKGIKDLQPGTNSLQWLFAGGNDKGYATKAYENLSALASGIYGETVKKMDSDVKQMKLASNDDAWRDFESNQQVYKSTFHELVPNDANNGEYVQPIAVTLSQLDQLDQIITTCDSAIVNDKKKVREASLRLAAKDTISILQNIPVEEINREGAGVRTKALRDQGFTTIADVYGASVYQLSSIYGISELSAYNAKQAAQTIANQVAANAKIRLNADNRTPDASSLISAIYNYKTKKKKHEELVELVRQNRPDLNRARKTLEDVGNGVAWLFFSDEQKETTREAYKKTSELLNGEYARNVDQIADTLQSETHVDDNDAWADFTKNNVEYFTALEDIIPGILGNDDSLYGLPEDLAREIQDEAFFPDGLLCTLRRYQEWGVKYILHQERVLLGDEMGLGKTVQAIAAMVSLRNTGATHFVVICPASVVSNWCREITKHSKLRATKVHGAHRLSALRSWKETGGVAVTTYETTAYFKLEDDYHFDLLVVDEAHYVKNPEARRTINVKNLCSHTDRMLFMTGTALENRVEEMISLIRILQPQIASTIQGMAFMSTAPQFREKVAPVYYRRKREDVLTELPEKIESKEWCELTPEEEQVYEDTVLSKNYAAVRRVSWNVGDLKCSSKANRMLEIIEDAELEERKVIVFSFFLDTIRVIGELLGTKCYGPINGSVPPQRRQEIIDEFDEAPAGSVLLAQIQSGGTGLNIQSASVVIICEPQFKPSIENQAISRAYRMGQARNVLVYRLLCENTVDESITELLENKQTIFDAFADKSVAAEKSVELDEKGFGQIIQDEIDRINAKRGIQAQTNSFK